MPQYIDDRHVGQLYRAPASSTLPSNRVLAQNAAYILCYLLIEAGYVIAIAKSQCILSTVIRFLGFLCDSVRQAFLLPPDKKLKFQILREEILSSRYVGLRGKLSRSVWPFLVANSTSVKLSRPFPSSAAPLSLSFALRETFEQRFYTGVSSMIAGIVSLGASSFT